MELTRVEKSIEGLDDLDWLEDYLKGFDDVDWNEDWQEISELCGMDSICCVQQREPELDSCQSLVACDTQLIDTANIPSGDTANLPSVPASSNTAIVPQTRFSRRVSNRHVEKAISNRIPKNTSKSTNWGVSIFDEWLKEREIHKPFDSMSDSELNQTIAVFVHEVVKKDGVSPYPPNSLYQIVVSIQRFLRENGRPGVSFFDNNQPCFDTLSKSLDARMKELTAEGIGVSVKQAQPITKDMESILWEKQIFSRSSADGLLNIVYFYNTKLFGLRAGDEHRALCVEQFQFGYSVDGCAFMHFTGRSCKNYQGGLHQRKVFAKDLKIFAVPELGERDIVDCFKLYTSLIPSDGPFYRRPMKKVGNQPKFSTQVVGKNALNTLVQKFCTEAGFQGYFTGHSGKVSCATQLFEEQVDEQLIQKYTGHRSTDSVRRYKRPNEDHFKQVSKILQPPPVSTVSGTENEEAVEKKAIEPPEKKANQQNDDSGRIPLAPLNKLGSSFYASGGGSITFNFNYHSN